MIKGGLPSDFIDEVRNKNDIVEIASKYMTLNRRGYNFWACCPFHNEKTPSFSIKQDGQFYKCFGCGESGNVISLVMKMENMDFLQAVEMLAKNANIPMPSAQDNIELQKLKKERDTIYQILSATTEFYQKNLLSKPNSLQGEYLKGRNISAEMIQKFKIGASFNYEDLPLHLKKLGFKEEDMIKAGVVGRGEKGNIYDFYGTRLIFPIFNGFGDVVAFSGRSVDNKIDHAKYKNTPQSLVFNKSEILFGYNFVRDLKKERMLDTIIIVEGHIDVIMCHQAGFTNTIGCMGTALTTLHARKIKQLVDNVILCLDGDNAGNIATYKAIDTLKEVRLNVKVTRLKQAKDPDEFIKKFGKNNFLDELNNAIDCVDFVLYDSAKKYDLNKNLDKTKYIAEALNYISKFSTEAEQEIYLTLVQKLVKIPMDALRKSLNKSEKISNGTEEKPIQTETVQNNYITESKIMLLASLLYKKFNDFDKVSSLFNSDDELTDLYKFLKEKCDSNKDFNVSTLFDNFEIKDKSLIDRVINYVFPDDSVYNSFLMDTIKRVNLYNLQQQKQYYTELMQHSATDAERYDYLTKIKQITDKIKKERV